jgi:pyruvate/2-oxoglutarate/acetoin dehydrogenase E1 component
MAQPVVCTATNRRTGETLTIVTCRVITQQVLDADWNVQRIDLTVISPTGRAVVVKDAATLKGTGADCLASITRMTDSMLPIGTPVMKAVLDGADKVYLYNPLA